jgi:D-serine deaminase-like pyridoxal phosphate-dependent protein
MASMKRRRWLAGAAVLGVGGALALRPSDQGGPHDSYFTRLQQALRAAGPAMPTLVVDQQRYLANLERIAQTRQAGLALRVVVKSLPSLSLITHALKAWNTERVMTFNAPQLLALARARPSVQVLLGKPMPVSTAAWVLDQLAGLPFNAARQIEWLIDTPARAAQYRDLARARGVPLRLNVELDVGLHRGGIEADAALVDLLKLVQSEPLLSWSGFMGYDAHVAAIPDLPGARAGAAEHARIAYARHFATAQTVLGTMARDTLTLNTGGSLTYHLHDGKQVPNELSVGSAAVKPLDFERDSTQALQAASFIATPVLKTMDTFRLPTGVEWLSRAAATWDTNQARALAIHGGHWLADPVSPPGVKPSGLYGTSSNQQVMVAPVSTQLATDDWLFLRPRQSEAVFLQFGDIAVFDGKRITERWPVFAASA